MTAAPHFGFEATLDPRFRIIGVDEVGRGALAGPVVAGAVYLGRRLDWAGLGINDSKKLSALKRVQLDNLIREQALGWGIGVVDVATINRVGIVRATERAMRQAVSCIRGEGKFLLIDAFPLKYTRGVGLKNQLAIIKGDEQSLSIAAASIIAKVYRDELMVKLHERFPDYEWANNKGYGTKKHLEALAVLGVSRWHRPLFVRGIIC